MELAATSPEPAPPVLRRGSAGEGQPLLEFLVGAATVRRATGAVARGQSSPLPLPANRGIEAPETVLPKTVSYTFGSAAAALKGPARALIPASTNAASPSSLPAELPSSALPSLPDRAPASLPTELYALLEPCVDRFFAFTHRLIPVVHRPSFLRACSGQTTDIFGGLWPLSLQMAMAAEGAFTAPMPSEALRRAAIRGFADFAKDLLDASPMLDLGSCLATGILCGVYAAAGAPARGDDLLAGAARTCDALYRSLPRTTPATASEWLLREQTVRLRVLLSLYDTTAAARKGCKTSAAYFMDEIYPMPCADLIYDSDDHETSFRALQSASPTALHQLCRPGCQYSGHALPPAGLGVVSWLLGPEHAPVCRAGAALSSPRRTLWRAAGSAAVYFGALCFSSPRRQRGHTSGRRPCPRYGRPGPVHLVLPAASRKRGGGMGPLLLRHRRRRPPRRHCRRRGLRRDERQPGRAQGPLLCRGRGIRSGLQVGPRLAAASPAPRRRDTPGGPRSREDQ
ncbi:hypothetical protein DFJ74DRAFT_660377 [Hyaloraphidium curvatum]|nr:hypothetical protein DFJ74DRAFT_660377 [Hyaloraphidium curvatum]